MRTAVAFSLAGHLLLLGGMEIGGRHSVPVAIEARFIDVSLVSLGAPGVSSGAPTKSRQVAAAPISPKPEPTKAKAAKKEKPVPDVAERPIKKKEKSKPAPEERSSASETTQVEPAKTSLSAETSAGGPAMEGIRLDTGNFEFSYYLWALRNKIAAHWSPGAGGEGREPRKTTIYFRVTRNGSLEGVKVESSSGIPFFDQSALRAVLAASPLAPLPWEFGEDFLGVHFEFVHTP